MKLYNTFILSFLLNFLSIYFSSYGYRNFILQQLGSFISGSFGIIIVLNSSSSSISNDLKFIFVSLINGFCSEIFGPVPINKDVSSLSNKFWNL